MKSVNESIYSLLELLNLLKISAAHCDFNRGDMIDGEQIDLFFLRYKELTVRDKQFIGTNGTIHYVLRLLYMLGLQTTHTCRTHEFCKNMNAKKIGRSNGI